MNPLTLRENSDVHPATPGGPGEPQGDRREGPARPAGSLPNPAARQSPRLGPEITPATIPTGTQTVTGKSYNPVSFIHELKGFDNWGETFNYIHQHYGVQVKNTEARYDNQLPELILILTSSVEITRDNSPELEIAILQFLKKDKAPLDNFLSKSKELYI